ncbi:MAG: capsule assembly Wzi family protein [Hahellaceae bacterium]|nr:capsule assembly Wzi family protein [Hahellaceae bacterium]
MTAKAAPWVTPDDVSARLSLTALVDAGVMRLNIATWPIAWASIDRELTRVDETRLSSPGLRRAYRHLVFEVSRVKQNSVLAEAGLRASNESPYLNGFGDTQHEKNEAWLQLEGRGRHWAGALKVTALEGNYDDVPHARLDGSYLAFLAGNWVIGAGAVERWWGPGWSNALSLSTNAHPVPGLFLRRLADDAPESPWFSWMGPVSFEAFMGQLEEDRYVSDAKFLGLRFSMQPFAGLELGFFRNAQWGGEGRPQSLSSLFDLLLGRDNFSAEDEGKSTEPGNQIAGVDARYSLGRWGLPLALYMQFYGEDEANLIPSKRAWILGGEGSVYIPSGDLLKVWVEYTNTIAGGLEGTPKYNTAYNHSIYKSGYRFGGRNLGSAFDSDSEVFTLGTLYQTSRQALIGGHFDVLKLNKAGDLRTAAPGGEFYQTDTWSATGFYQNNWRQWQYTAGLTVYGDQIATQLANSGDFRIFVEGVYRF